MEVDGRTLELTSLERVLYPEARFTKADLVDYVFAIAPKILPHLRGRPVTVGRFPQGVDGRGFAQLEIPGRPAWVRTIPLALASGEVKHVTMVDDRATLVWLAQMGTIELHTFLSDERDLERPRAVLFDLDPAPPRTLVDAQDAALLVREALRARGLPAIVKTSGGTGMHVVSPLDGPTYDETRALAQAIATELREKSPELVLDRMVRSARAGKVLIDVRQNSPRLTTIVPWSLRAAACPTVSTPLRWEEVEAACAAREPLVFLARDAITRADAWAETDDAAPPP
jgi:bifunctional non-homologous end joining protein LigD